MAGVAGRSGRKSRAQEAGLDALIDSAVSQKDWKEIFLKASSMAKRGDIPSARFLAEYRFGKPNQKIEMTGGGGGPLVIQYVNDWRNVADEDTTTDSA